MDVQVTKDGQLILMHDRNLKRVAGVKKNTWEVTYGEIKNLDVGSWFSPRFSGETIPTLGEVIDTVKGRAKLNIELKCNAYQQQLVPRVVNLIEEQKFTDECILTSFNYPALIQIKELNPGLTRGLIASKVLKRPLELQVDLYSLQATIATSKLISKAHAKGREVHVWTVNKISEIDKLLERGVDNIITNRPKAFREKLLAHGKKLSDKV